MYSTIREKVGRKHKGELFSRAIESTHKYNLKLFQEESREVDYEQVTSKRLPKAVRVTSKG